MEKTIETICKALASKKAVLIRALNVRGLTSIADDFVLATGETHSIEEFLTLAFAEIGIDDWRPYVVQNPAFMRPAEVDVLLGDASKAERKLGWKAETTFEQLISEMVEADMVRRRRAAA